MLNMTKKDFSFKFYFIFYLICILLMAQFFNNKPTLAYILIKSIK